MRVWRHIIVATIASLVVLVQPGIILAEAVFEPNFIISDDEMQNWRSLTLPEIQQFLRDQGGYIAQYRSLDAYGNTLPVAEIIYNAAKEYRINPKYLLVKLQKEQSLIVDPDPTQRQLDWATGYGVCDSCNTSDPDIQKFRGLGIQVDKAAAIMRWYYDNVQNESWIKRPHTSYLIDNVPVIPANLATAFLYTYTPHLHGNQNFWKLWQAWFGQLYPDGTIMKTVSDPTVYLVQGGKKRPFKNMTALVTRYDPRLIITVPSSELSRYESAAEIVLPNYSLIFDGSTYYLLDSETLRPFDSNETFRKFGYNPDEVISVDSAEIAQYPKSQPITATDLDAPLGRLVRVRGQSQLYYVRDGVYHHITDPRIAAINFAHLKEEYITSAELAEYQLGLPTPFKDGTLVRTKESALFYIIEGGKKRPIKEVDFIALGFRKENVLMTDEMTLLHHTTGQPLFVRELVQLANSSEAAPENSAEDVNSDGGGMQRTPVEATRFVGPQFATPVNTYVVMDYATGNILAAKNHEEARPLASLAKVMTAYQLLQEGINAHRYVTYDPIKHEAKYNQYRLASGERVYNGDLLNAMLVSSLNTPAKMLVSSIESKESAFIERMNVSAQAWGLTKTTFTDPAGVNTTTVGTAKDYATLFKRASANIDMRTYLSKASYEYDEVLDVDGKPHHYDVNSNGLFQKENLPFTIIASKTAYLEEAGAGLAMIIERPKDNKRFVIVTMGNPDYAQRFDEPEKLARWAINTF